MGVIIEIHIPRANRCGEGRRRRSVERKKMGEVGVRETHNPLANRCEEGRRSGEAKKMGEVSVRETHFPGLQSRRRRRKRKWRRKEDERGRSEEKLSCPLQLQLPPLQKMQITNDGEGNLEISGSLFGERALRIWVRMMNGIGRGKE